MEAEFLHHLRNAVPKSGYGNRLSMYLISLEAWRRGLKVTYFYEKNPENKMLVRYTLADEKNEYYFNSSLGDKLTEGAFDICENKDKTKKILSEAGLPVPKGKKFTKGTNIETIIDYANQLDYPLVLKPTNENAGIGVFSNIQNETAFRSALHHLQEDLGYDEILVEEHIDGNEYRIFFVNGEILAATNRIPANIKGDGVHSINELIENKNKSKEENPALSSKIIEKDKEVTDSVKALNYDYDTVPKNGETIYLRSKSNVSRGGDSIDVTDKLPDRIKAIAKNAANAIEGLDIGGLDMIIDDDFEKAVILEINTKPMIGLHVFPVEGNPIDVVSPMVDYYFPETINQRKSNLYFDFNSVISPIRDRSVTKVELTPLSTIKKYFGKKYIIKGELDSDFKQAIRQVALVKEINGHLKEDSSNEYELIITHENEEVLEDFINKVTELDSDSLLTYEQSNYDLPIKIGFEIKERPGYSIRIAKQREKINELDNETKKLNRRVNRYEKLNQELKSEIVADRQQNSILGKRIMKLEKENRKLIKKQDRLTTNLKETKYELNNMKKSSSWKVTKLLRNLKGFVKK